MSTTGEDLPQVFPDPTPLPSQTIIQPTPTPSVDVIFTELDDVNPSHVLYNPDATIVKEDDVEKIKRDFKPKKTYLRDVRSSKRRHT
jgi:hypothetical protein